GRAVEDDPKFDGTNHKRHLRREPAWAPGCVIGRGASLEGEAPPRRIGGHHDDGTENHPRQGWPAGTRQAARQCQPGLQTTRDWARGRLVANPLIRNLKVNNTTADCMRNSVGAPDRIEFVHQCTYMEFGRVDRYAKASSNRLVR